MIGKIIKPRIAVYNVNETELDTFKVVGVIESTELQTASVFIDINHATFEAFEIALVEIDKGVLPAQKVFAAVIDYSKLDATLGFVVVEEPPN